MHARNHRLLTPGHDPLIGLIVGVSDILRGGRTSFDLSGTAHFDAGLAAPESNPLVAVTRWVLHIISDAVTSMGLPAPGWTLAPLLQVGRFGEKGRTVADLAHFMYLNGYDLRHFLAAATTPLAIELSLIAYEAGRRYLDPDYDRRWIAAGPADGSRSHPKHIVLRLIGDAIASAANAGKIAVYGGNPLALNYAQWLSLIRSAVTYASHAGSSATDVMLEKAKRNEETLGREWEDLRLRGG
jgi:hypothetical protein